MKIRIKGNSVRFRLTKSEVALLCTTGLVTERTGFKDSALEYSVRAQLNAKAMMPTDYGK